jgi:hypothetical protein
MIPIMKKCAKCEQEQYFLSHPDPRKKEKCQAYNAALKKARISVEHCFGMIKKRFPALLYKLRCRKIENVQAIIGEHIFDDDFLQTDQQIWKLLVAPLANTARLGSPSTPLCVVYRLPSRYSKKSAVSPHNSSRW